MAASAAPSLARYLARAGYLQLTTFRKNGEGVPTTVWFALAGDHAYVVTDRDAGKAKRIRNNGLVRLAPSDWRGRPRGAALDATARIVVEPAEAARAERALRERYGWQWRLVGWLGARRRRRDGTPDNRIFLAITAP